MKRLKSNEIASYRNAKLKEQKGVCLLCEQPLDFKEATLDHDHVTGLCRGVIHRGCNSMLGKIENARSICKLTDDVALNNLLKNVESYLKRSLNVLHYTHLTDDEKRLKRNKKARLKRKEKTNEVTK